MTFSDSYLKKRCGEIEHLISEALAWSSTNEKLGAQLAAYISVLITGVIEDCVEYLFTQRVLKITDKEVEHYVLKVISERFRNPTYSSITGLLKEFSSDYQDIFKAKISHDGKEATALESVVDNKNSLAHIGTIKLQMTISEINDYYQRIIPILETVETILI